eukprot:757088-Hanusia_phi.AAC.3
MQTRSSTSSSRLNKKPSPSCSPGSHEARHELLELLLADILVDELLRLDAASSINKSRVPTRLHSSPHLPALPRTPTAAAHSVCASLLRQAEPPSDPFLPDAPGEPPPHPPRDDDISD